MNSHHQQFLLALFSCFICSSSVIFSITIIAVHYNNLFLWSEVGSRVSSFCVTENTPFYAREQSLKQNAWVNICIISDCGSRVCRDNSHKESLCLTCFLVFLWRLSADPRAAPHWCLNTDGADTMSTSCSARCVAITLISCYLVNDILTQCWISL